MDSVEGSLSEFEIGQFIKESSNRFDLVRIPNYICVDFIEKQNQAAANQL